MPVPVFLSAIGHFFGDVLGGFIGARLVGDLREKATEEAAKEVQRVLSPDREDVLKDLLRLGDEAAAILKLIGEANREGFVTVQERRYTENWIVNMLLKIEPKDRAWVYPILNAVLALNREEFFTLLEVLHNDGFLQWMQVLRAVVKEKLQPVTQQINTLAGQLETIRDQVKAWAQRR